MTLKKVKLGLVLLLSCLTASCSAQREAPEDQIIEGPFSITTEWQEFTLKKPLKTNPHVQKLKILLDENSYINDEDIDIGIISGGYKNLLNSKPLQPEVIFVDKSGKEFKTVYKSMGSSFISLGNYKFVGFGTNSKSGKFYYPPNTEFTAIKIKANIPFIAEHFWWSASWYSRAPNSKWEDIDPAEITHQ